MESNISSKRLVKRVGTRVYLGAGCGSSARPVLAGAGRSDPAGLLDPLGDIVRNLERSEIKPILYFRPLLLLGQSF